MGRILSPFCGASLCAALLLLASGCNRADEAKAKQDVRDLSHKIDQAVTSGGPANGSTQSAEEKLRKGSEDLRVAGEKAGVKLGRATLIAKVKTTLAADVGLSTSTSISVDARGQVVTLRGSVSSEEQKHQAEQAVAQVAGVDRVVNDLSVQP